MTRIPALYIDFVDTADLVQPVCVHGGEHTPEPRGYIAWHEWADAMSKTHRQRRCTFCGLWAVWVPKREEPLP